jgi:hypothetical protein
MAAKPRRFVTVYKESTLGGSTSVLADRQTGVLYLVRASGYGVAMTPLLGSDGKPVTGYRDGEW